MGKWKTETFNEVLTIINGRNQKAVEDSSGKYPIYGSGGIMGYANDYLCDANTTVIGRKGTINRPIFVEEPFWNVDTAFGLRANNDFLFPKYLYYFCESFNFEALNTTVTIPSLTKANLLQIEIPLPPLPVQQQIADMLDRANVLIEKRKAQIEKLDLLIKSQFIEMFGNPIANPIGWEEHMLFDYINFLTSGSRGWSAYFSKKGSAFLTIKNVKNSHLYLDNIQYVKPPNTKEAQRTRVQNNDLLISITADLGRTAVVTSDVADSGAYINQHLSLVRLDCTKVNPLYVSYFLESQAGKKQFEAKNQVGVKAGLNFDAIKSLKILIPPLSLQNEFASFVQQVESQKRLLQQSLAKLEQNYKSLMQKCFRGEIF